MVEMLALMIAFFLAGCSLTSLVLVGRSWGGFILGCSGFVAAMVAKIAHPFARWN